jgi:hypothetical protein
MDIWWKAAGTAITMAVVILTARRVHRRLAGVVAAFPMVTAPALLWLARDPGPAFAAAAAVASVASCLMQAGFALGYARAARHAGPVASLGWGLAAAGVMAALGSAIGNQLMPAAGAAAAGVAVCRWLLPAAGDRAGVASRPAAQRGWGEVALTIVASALLSTLAASLGADWGPFAAGLLASLPVVCGTVAVVEHVRHGPAVAGAFLHAYTEGLFARIVFGAVFALAVPAWGGTWAVLLATACGIAASALAHGRPGAAAASVAAAKRA